MKSSFFELARAFASIMFDALRRRYRKPREWTDTAHFRGDDWNSDP